MRPLLFFFLFFLLLLVLMGGAGIGIGFLLHWLVPAIGVDIGTLIAVIALGWTLYFFLRIMNALSVISYGETADSEFETIILKPMQRRRSTRKRK